MEQIVLEQLLKAVIQLYLFKSVFDFRNFKSFHRRIVVKLCYKKSNNKSIFNGSHNPIDWLKLIIQVIVLLKLILEIIHSSQK
ncbi:MAG: hypothetical protein ACYCZO_12240 [Daejeonella sp.]